MRGRTKGGLRRLLSAFLALVMAVGVLPAGVLAADPAISTTVEHGNARVEFTVGNIANTTSTSGTVTVPITAVWRHDGWIGSSNIDSNDQTITIDSQSIVIPDVYYSSFAQ